MVSAAQDRLAWCDPGDSPQPIYSGFAMAPHPLFRHWVPTADLTGDIRTEVEMAGDEPSGLDWLPDGRLVVVAMESQQLRRVERDGKLPLRAGLSLVAGASLNDMINAS